MMKCKVAIDDKNECTNCCYFCDKKDTCNDVCQDIAKVCEEQVEETDLQVIESTVPDVLKAITDITMVMKVTQKMVQMVRSWCISLSSIILCVHLNMTDRKQDMVII